jgi:aspartyl-tRNA(Asn)/glutamyl-tRNA(Gln) amidotransferase subunit A
VVDEPWTLSLAEAASLIEAGLLSPVELVQAYLDRIESHEEIYRAFNLVLADEALAEARRLEGAPWRGPLHGIPLAVKDNFYTAGVRTTANSHIYQDFIPEFDATVVRRLLGGGGILLGKTQMGPLASGRATTPDGEHTTANAWAPHDPDVNPGGSSSGSATSVAGRLASSSIGTQTGGSVTGPAGLQGLTGLKPTMGRASLYGVVPLTYTRDHPGTLARDARDAAIMIQTMSGPDPSDPRTLGLPQVPDLVTAAVAVQHDGRPGLRWPTTIGVLPDYLEVDEEQPRPRQREITQEERRRRRARSQAEVEARRRMLQTFEHLGARVVEVDYPPDWEPLTNRTFNNVRLPERSDAFLDVLRDDVRKFGASLVPWINGLLLPGMEYLRGQRTKLVVLRQVLDHLFGHCDVVVQTQAHRFDIIGLPLITFPIGFEDASSGVPLPVPGMLGGLPYAEDRLLALAAAYQSVTNWHQRRPAEPGDFPGVQMGEGYAPTRHRVDLRDLMYVEEDE